VVEWRFSCGGGLPDLGFWADPTEAQTPTLQIALPERRKLRAFDSRILDAGAFCWSRMLGVSNAYRFGGGTTWVKGALRHGSDGLVGVVATTLCLQRSRLTLRCEVG